MKRGMMWSAATVCLLSAGCGGTSAFLNYVLPAQLSVPQRVKQVAVVRFKALQQTDNTYGEVAAAQLNDSLIKSGRYEMYSRRNLDKIIEEQDFRESGMALADKVRTQLTSVDAIITGSVDAGAQFATEAVQVTDPNTGYVRTVMVRHMIAEATLTFEMLEVDTGRVVASVGEVAKYDSHDDGGGLMALAAMMGGGAYQPKLPPPNSKLQELIQECVQKFAQKVAPYAVSVKVKLESGDNLVDTGNKFAKAGNWRDAARYYRDAVAADAENKEHGARFNLGVALEALGQFKEADEAYSSAIRIKAKSKYIERQAEMRRLAGVAP